MACFPITRRCN